MSVSSVQGPTSLFDKIWQQHHVASVENNNHLIYIDRIFLHERTGSIALESLFDANRQVKNPKQVFCTMDHIVDTFPGRNDQTLMPSGVLFIESTRQSAKQAGIRLFDLDDPQQGIVHVISPELGIVQPGTTLICPDSHTCTQGAVGALAWGIGSSEAEHAMATQTLRLKKPPQMRIYFDGELASGVTAKDLMLYVISQYGASGGTGYAIEFAGPVVSQLSIEARMTLCNMAVEFAAFTALIAPDDKTAAYLQGREYAPHETQWQAALDYWQSLQSDEGYPFDKEIRINCSEILPQVTWGTSPEHACAITASIPKLNSRLSEAQLQSYQRALNYQDLQAGSEIAGEKIDCAFIGSCTNARLEDLREAASILRGKKVSPWVKAICVPGSKTVKAKAEAEGLDNVFIDAGFEWREPGCSMCFYAGGEHFPYQARVISTTNRNFESRQGPQTRTHLASPMTVAASAITGTITDPRYYLTEAMCLEGEIR